MTAGTAFIWIILHCSMHCSVCAICIFQFISLHIVPRDAWPACIAMHYRVDVQAFFLVSFCFNIKFQVIIFGVIFHWSWDPRQYRKSQCWGWYISFVPWLACIFYIKTLPFIQDLLYSNKLHWKVSINRRQNISFPRCTQCWLQNLKAFYPLLYFWSTLSSLLPLPLDQSRISMFDESLLRDRQGWRCAPRQVSSSVWQLDSSLDVSLQPGSAACRDKIRTQHPSTLFSSLLKQPRDPHQVLESVFQMVWTCGLDQIASKGVLYWFRSWRN